MWYFFVYYHTKNRTTLSGNKTNGSFYQLRECELGAIVNRDLQRRIRSVSGVTLERPVLRADARLAARLAHLLDTRTQLWSEQSADAEEKPVVSSDVSPFWYRPLGFLLFQVTM